MTSLAPAEAFAAALNGRPCLVWTEGEPPRPLPVDRWQQTANADDLEVLSHCRGATIDVGCGPGRMGGQLALLGHVTLGIDVVAEAVAQTQARGVPAIQRNVFKPLPGEGRWETALLADGNIGIGGDPHALLTRLREVVDPTRGRIVVDLQPPGVGIRRQSISLEVNSEVTAPIPWCEVGVDAVDGLARSLGMRAYVCQVGERWHAELRCGG